MRSTFIFPYPINTIDLPSQSTISTLQNHTLKVSSIIGINKTPNRTSDTQEFKKSKKTIIPSYCKDLSHVVENNDSSAYSSRAEYKMTRRNAKKQLRLYFILWINCTTKEERVIHYSYFTLPIYTV